MAASITITNTVCDDLFFFFFVFEFPHSPLLTLPTAPCSPLATILRAPHPTSHCHSPTSPDLPLSQLHKFTPFYHSCQRFFTFIDCDAGATRRQAQQHTQEDRAARLLRTEKTLPRDHPNTSHCTPHLDLSPATKQIAAFDFYYNFYRDANILCHSFVDASTSL